MTGRAVKRPVSAPQREVRHRVLERRVLPKELVVALSAVRKRAVVNVVLLMATDAHLALASQDAVGDVTLIALKHEVHSL